MNKLRNISNKINVAKIAPYAMLCAYSFNAVYCSQFFTGIGNLIGNIAKGLLGVVSAVALLMIVINGVLLIFSASDQKAKDARKQAILTIFKVYGIILISGFILSSIYSLATEAFGNGNVMDTSKVNPDGTLMPK